jgi:hypothetical protein
MTRPRLQLHLSTLVVLTLFTGAFIGMNCLLGSVKVPTSVPLKIRGNIVTVHMRDHPRGWPMTFQVVTSIQAEDDSFKSSGSTGFSGWRLAANVCICLALLAVSAVAIEWVTRHMKRKTTP